MNTININILFFRFYGKFVRIIPIFNEYFHPKYDFVESQMRKRLGQRVLGLIDSSYVDKDLLRYML